MHMLYQAIAHLPDLLILLVGALAMASVAVVLAVLTRGLLYAGRGPALDTHAKLAELVHGSLLAFAVFVLALVLSDVRANHGKAEDAAAREASLLVRFDRDLRVIGNAEAEKARGLLRDYVRAVTADEWNTLSGSEPELSAKATAVMGQLWIDIRKLEDAGTAASGSLRAYLDRLEDLRQGRLEAATKTVPHIFWWMVMTFLVAAMAMNGRYELTPYGLSLIFTHMAGIGLVLALILVLDEPFRGETSISPAPLARAVGLPPP